MKGILFEESCFTVRITDHFFAPDLSFVFSLPSGFPPSSSSGSTGGGNSACVFKRYGIRAVDVYKKR
jgi:hypothetical protein